MKLLFDQNISFRVIQLIHEHFPEARQVKQLHLENKSDKAIWNYCRENGYTIITFDSDFYDLSTLYGCPPKIIWLRIGNTSTKNLADFLVSKAILIKEFVTNPAYEEVHCLEFD